MFLLAFFTHNDPFRRQLKFERHPSASGMLLVDAVEARYHGFQRCFFVSCVFTGHYPGAPNREKAETTTRGLLASEFFFCKERLSPVVPLPWRTPRVFFCTMNSYRKGY